jgi:hypothetical protein
LLSETRAVRINVVPNGASAALEVTIEPAEG